ncbi:tripartite tricarboxylate transporter TctB family protein [Lentibacillus salicampi]|uniref:Tripartite tricarboxylate transporter TctB family protein n=1 Tax=Lentibacillus salicampi TaxID=175306 RepID=A0A4Y9AD61_9BACI|nr:tripartite tricarboxylate transporter TctB family protein [Lentibacillus salicampi]TFJ93262.1 tripartite tricarboxylate transporter TctB family protein [Lentibacillus salicampi]
MLKSADRKISVVLIALAIGYLILSYQLPPYEFVPVDSDLMPKALGYLLIALAVGLFFTGKSDADEDKKEESTTSKSETPALLAVTAMVLAYILLLEVLGFVIVTVLFVFFCSWFLGYKKFKVNATVSILFPVILYYIFNYLLQIRLPAGILPF